MDNGPQIAQQMEFANILLRAANGKSMGHRAWSQNPEFRRSIIKIDFS
jgi:hypothetical protein